jgi:hypothetical protein
MTAVAELEPSAVHAPGTDIAPLMAQAIEEYRPRIVMAAEEAAALDGQLRQMMRAVLVENTDYGTVPGSTKPSLWKPGAEKLLQWFGFGHRIEKVEIERNEDGSRLGVTYRCTVFKEMGDGREVTVSTCEGYTGYDEDTFYTTEEAARRKAEANERKWARQYNRAVQPEKWEHVTEYRAPWNTLIKIAQKRALVGAALQATSASTLFTQDLEDTRGQADDAGALPEAGTAALMALPPDVRRALDQWRCRRGWPEAAKWDARQWCSALQMAGFLAARREKPKPGDAEARPGAGGGGTPGTQPQSDAGVRIAAQGPGEADWVRAFLTRLADARTDADIRARRSEVIRAAAEKIIATPTANELLEDVKRRGAEIRKPVAA